MIDPNDPQAGRLKECLAKIGEDGICRLATVEHADDLVPVLIRRCIHCDLQHKLEMWRLEDTQLYSHAGVCPSTGLEVQVTLDPDYSQDFSEAQWNADG